jgi:hypothetical protein
MVISRMKDLGFKTELVINNIFLSHESTFIEKHASHSFRMFGSSL